MIEYWIKECISFTHSSLSHRKTKSSINSQFIQKFLSVSLHLLSRKTRYLVNMRFLSLTLAPAFLGMAVGQVKACYNQSAHSRGKSKYL